MGTDTGVNLLSPGKNGLENLQFVTFLVNVLMAVYKHNDLLKASICSATNAHRLGANEAPPAIVSVFLGKQISEVLDKLETATTEEAITMDPKSGLKIGVAHIPEILLDNTDRNRTSPFAFTGNRFEFRAVGSSANCGEAMIVLNTAVAAQLNDFYAEVEQLIAGGTQKEKAIFSVIRKLIKECKAIRFDGNGYSEEWKAEAARRGLDCETSVPVNFDAYLRPNNVEIFTSTHVLSEVELHSRCDVKWETYTKKIQIEARVLGDLAVNHIVPVASRYQSVLLDNIAKFNALFPADEAKTLAEQDMKMVRKVAKHITAVMEKVDAMVNARKVANKLDEERAKAIAYHDTVQPLMDEIRYHIDKLELIVDNEMWPLPKYRELLFIR